MFIYPKECVSEEHGSSHSRAAQGRRRHLQVALEAPQGALQAEAARLRRTPRLHQGCHQTGTKNIPEFEKKNLNVNWRYFIKGYLEIIFSKIEKSQKKRMVSLKTCSFETIEFLKSYPTLHCAAKIMLSIARNSRNTRRKSVYKRVRGN